MLFLYIFTEALTNASIETTGGTRVIALRDENITEIQPFQPQSDQILDEKSFKSDKYIITSLGTKSFYNCTYVSITLPGSISYISNFTFAESHYLELVNLSQTNITRIPESSFKNCSKLSIVILPNSLMFIDAQSFSATNLTQINIPSNVTLINNYSFAASALQMIDLSKLPLTSIHTGTFYKCVNLKEVIFPPSLSEIEARSFLQCPISKLSLEKTRIISIGERAFGLCSSLLEVTFNDDVLELGASAFYKCSLLPSIDISMTKIDTIGTRCFCSCSLLATIKFPSTLETIGKFAFLETGLTEIDFPHSLKNLKIGVFQNCTELLRADLTYFADNIIPDHLFDGCISLMSISLPQSFISIGERAFAQTAVTNFPFPPLLESIAACAFAGNERLGTIDLSHTAITRLDDGVFDNCSALSSVSLPSAVESIGSRCFYGTALSNFSVPSKLKVVMKAAFGQCKSLTSFIANDSELEIILDSAFFGCEKLEAVKLPKTLKLIGDAAFAMSGLKEIKFESLQTTKRYNLQDAFFCCRNLEGIDLLSTSISCIGPQMFAYTTSLRTITFPNTLVSIEERAFYGCGINDLILPTTIEKIGKNCFTLSGITSLSMENCTIHWLIEPILNNCQYLTEVILPSSVSLVSNDEFYNSNNLKIIKYYGNHMLSLDKISNNTIVIRNKGHFPEHSLGTQTT